MKRGVLAWALALVVASACLAEPVAHEPEPARLARVLEVVRETHHPLVVFFHAPWCRGCNEFIHDVLSDPGLVKALGDTPVVAYNVDTENGRDAFESCKLQTIPSLVVLDREGVMSVLTSPPRDVGKVVAFLQTAHVLTASRPAAAPAP